MFEVRQIISVFSKMRLERKKFGNHWSKPSVFEAPCLQKAGCLSRCTQLSISNIAAAVTRDWFVIRSRVIALSCKNKVNNTAGPSVMSKTKP